VVCLFVAIVKDCGMTTADARQYIGAFGKIHANGTLYPRWLYGRITEADRSSIAFTDLSGELHIFRTSKVVDFQPKALRRIGWKMPKKFIQK
jgi:hypothetical protein